MDTKLLTKEELAVLTDYLIKGSSEKKNPYLDENVDPLYFTANLQVENSPQYLSDIYINQLLTDDWGRFNKLQKASFLLALPAYTKKFQTQKWTALALQLTERAKVDSNEEYVRIVGYIVEAALKNSKTVDYEQVKSNCPNFEKNCLDFENEGENKK
ncbi:hypothetical protein HK099_001309 [Clydaea vesicula]|uniref:Uncharacterized protein n=1 Tax=Clydaea vesicula TaxID=447962 RepID=A0AAD5TWW8_9FUNG|nr:hypothetical protein HK099_001309 [Clydaea vesicula]